MSAIRRCGRTPAARARWGLGLALAAAALLSACPSLLDLTQGPGGGWPDGGSAPSDGVLVANAGRDRFAAPGSELVLDAGASFSTDGAALSYLWSQIEGPAVTLSDPAAPLSRLRAPSEPARLVFLVTVSDGLREATDHVAILVGGDDGHAPFAVAGPDLEVAPGAVVDLVGGGSWDADGDALTYAWREIRHGAAGAPFAETPTAAFTAPDAPGTVVLRLEVRDDALEAADDRVLRVVPDPAAHPPSLVTDTPTTVDPGAAVTLTAVASDPDADPVSVAWRQVAGPAVALRREGDGAAFDAPARVADLAFVATASDGRLASAPSPVLVRVTAGPDNAPPVAVAPPDLEAAPGAAVLLDASASFDPDGDPLAGWLWTQVAGPPVVPADPTAARLAFDAPDTECLLTFSLAVYDGVVWSAPVLVRVQVLPPT